VLTKERKISVIGFTTMKAKTKESNECNDRDKNKRHLWKEIIKVWIKRKR